jgi:predicted dehydrogenase
MFVLYPEGFQTARGESVSLMSDESLFPRIGLVGCGAVGDIHRERLTEQNAEIVAICDPDSEALSRMARKLTRRPQLFRSEQDLLSAGGIDAVILCTPHGLHATQIEASLNADAHVLCEKPFVSGRDNGERLVRLAREKNKALFVAFTRRSRGHARFLESVVPKIGPLLHVQMLRTQPWLQKHQRTWRMRESTGGGFLVDAGASMLDLLLRLIPEGLSSTEARLHRVGNVEMDIRAQVRLGFSNGAQAELALIGDATERIEHITLIGENGTAGWFEREGAPPDLYFRPNQGPSEQPKPSLYRTLLPDAAFIAALRSGRRFDEESGQDLYDAATALPVIGLLENIYRVAVWQ